MATHSDSDSGVIIALIFVMAVGVLLIIAMKNDFHFIIY